MAREWRLAVASYRDALKHHPADQLVANNLAWILATCPEEGLRSGEEALQLMTFVQSSTRDWWMLGTLAAAYAELGRFAEAKIWGSRASQLAAGADDGKWEKWIAGFEKGQPVRE